MKDEIVLFEAKDGSFAMPVQIKADTACGVPLLVPIANERESCLTRAEAPRRGGVNDDRE